ncbi:hypothetical protein WN51_07610 [Melipona quadrifasciata]|uniref:Uncharacterized protein n=1 Tax=Melipona quadrifasciata TaxID=166423 RepID=A0A0M8ZR81_9HYME|nr:hypothetical protein WN51_07610 [Melipona quadrifasciata]
MAPIYTPRRSSRSKQLRPQPRNTLIAKLAASLHTWITLCENSHANGAHYAHSARTESSGRMTFRGIAGTSVSLKFSTRETLTFARRPTTPASFYRLGGSLDEIQKGLMSTLLYLL